MQNEKKGETFLQHISAVYTGENKPRLCYFLSCERP